MINAIDLYWDKRLVDVANALRKNNFSSHIFANKELASAFFFNEIIAEYNPESFSFGGTTSVVNAGVYAKLKELYPAKVIDTLDKTMSLEEKTARKRKALLCDMFLASTNALTETGVLVNLDMVGNRVGPMLFGPKNVVLFVGRNKIVKDKHEAFSQIRNFTAPTNIGRLQMQTPCLHTGRCQDCSSDARICNSWTIQEKAFPKGRTIVLLINEDLSF